MSREERKLMQIIDKIIIEGDPKKLAEIQQIDMNTLSLMGFGFMIFVLQLNKCLKNLISK